MGDRANFGFRENNRSPVIILYAHWGGFEMLANLAQALEAARPRWRDSGYATRIAISQLVGVDWNQESSYGIYIDKITDNEHSIPVVNWQDQTVSIYEFDYSRPPDFYNDTPVDIKSFDTFINSYNKVNIQ